MILQEAEDKEKEIFDIMREGMALAIKNIFFSTFKRRFHNIFKLNEFLAHVECLTISELYARY